MEKKEVDKSLFKAYNLAQRLSTLNEITLQIDAAENKLEIYEILRNETHWLLNCEILALAILSQIQTTYQIISLSSISDATGLNESYFTLEEGSPGWVIRNQNPIKSKISNIPQYSHTLEGKYEDLGIQNLMVIPIKSGQNKVGAFIFGSIDENEYTEDDLIIAQLYGLQVAVALNNATFVEDAKKRISQIESMNEISRILNATLDINQLLEQTAQAIQRNFNYFDVTIFLLSEDQSELILKAHSGNYIDFLPKDYRQKITDGIIGWVARNGENALVNDVTQDPRYKSYEYHNTKSELALPIKIEGKLVGVLNIEDKNLYAFDEMDVVVLQTLCEQIASALKNAKLFEEVKSANEKLQELDTMKSEFLGIVSHDFRSPLSSIILAGKALLKNEEVLSNQRLKEYLQLIVDQANRLNQLAEDTLQITKIETGQVSIAWQIVNTERMIKEAISAVRFSNRHTVSYYIDPDVSYIKADPAKLRQVVQNLISNAVKYSPNGGKVNIEVREHNNDEILFSVSDEGIGIKPEHRDKLFQKFSRVDSEHTKNIKGTGLGLWICKEIVEAHKGRIWVESEVGKGSTFKFAIKKMDN
ncbi:MAG: Two-component sensor histidine kinase [Ignavibacteriae bacterium]|nr:MAG: Two-component sensor histidine kinase [Ignavibacteriota bacterium]